MCCWRAVRAGHCARVRPRRVLGQQSPPGCCWLRENRPHQNPKSTIPRVPHTLADRRQRVAGCGLAARRCDGMHLALSFIMPLSSLALARTVWQNTHSFSLPSFRVANALSVCLCLALALLFSLSRALTGAVARADLPHCPPCPLLLVAGLALSFPPKAFADSGKLGFRLRLCSSSLGFVADGPWAVGFRSMQHAVFQTAAGRIGNLQGARACTECGTAAARACAARVRNVQPSVCNVRY